MFSKTGSIFLSALLFICTAKCIIAVAENDQVDFDMIHFKHSSEVLNEDISHDPFSRIHPNETLSYLGSVKSELVYSKLCETHVVNIRANGELIMQLSVDSVSGCDENNSWSATFRNGEKPYSLRCLSSSYYLCDVYTNASTPLVDFRASSTVEGKSLRTSTSNNEELESVSLLKKSEKSVSVIAKPVSSRSATSMSATTTPLSYCGGALIPNPNIIPIYWNSAVKNQATFNAFYAAIVGSNYMSFFTEYSTASYKFTTGTRGTPYVDNKASTSLISQATVEAELIRLISSGLIPLALNNVYMIHFPPGVTISTKYGNSCSEWCGIHQYVSFSFGIIFPYAMIPDSSGCGGCGNGDVSEDQSVASHEFAEIITDPEVRNGWLSCTPGALCYEIGDLCSWQLVSMKLNDGKMYTVQREWSNKRNLCAVPMAYQSQSILTNNQKLLPNQCIYSPSNQYSLCLQSDSHLVGYDDNSVPFWTNSPIYYTAGYCIMQVDGNFVCYDSNNVARWMTGNVGTSTAPYRLVIQDDRNIVVYDSNSIMMWNSQTCLVPPCIFIGIVAPGRWGPGGPAACFPAEAEVEMAGKGVVSMKDLQYGDKVKVMDSLGKESFEEVYLFGHREGAAWSEFIALETKDRVLHLSPTHFARVCTSGCNDEGLAKGQYGLKSVYAKDVEVGDLLLVNDVNGVWHFSEVEDIIHTMERGLFNPYVRGGDLVVNGVVVSSHSEWFLDEYKNFVESWGYSLPDIYETLLYPVYLLYRGMGPINADWWSERIGLNSASSTQHVPYLLAVHFILAIATLSTVGVVKQLLRRRR